MTRFTPRVEHLDGDVFDTIQAFCRLVVPKASPHDGRNAMRGEKRGVPTYIFAHREGAACPFSVGFRVGLRTRISLRGMKRALLTVGQVPMGALRQ